MSGPVRVRVIVPSDDPLPDLFTYVPYDEGWVFPNENEARLWISAVTKVWPGLKDFEFFDAA